jgi:ADP-heptose:LPS heptosyltransferase
VRILLTRLDRVGDLVLSTPAIASVRRSWPGARVTLACSAHNAPVAVHNPDIDDLLVLEPGESAAELGHSLRGAFDAALALAPCGPDFRLVGATRARVRAGYTYVRRYAARATARLFLTKLAVSEADPHLAERSDYAVRHEVEQVLDVVRVAGGKALARDLVVPVTEADRALVAGVPAGALAFHLGARWLREGSTLESAIALVRELRRFELPLVVTYGADAAAAAAEVTAARVADAVVGGLPFSAWAAVFEKSRLVVTVDTGATHVASAVRRPTVVLFEHRYFHLSSQEWSPYRVPAACLRKPAGESPAELAESRAAVATAVGNLLQTSASPAVER